MQSQPSPERSRSPHHLPTPPPLAFALTDAGRTVGWVHGDAVGFRGFADEAEASHAAWIAYRTLAQRIARDEGRRPVPIDTVPLTLVRDGDVETVRASGRRIATLIRPGATSRSGADSFGFELRVPPPIYEVRVRGIAYLLYRTLRKSGVRWAMWIVDRGPARVGREAAMPRTRPDTIDERATAAPRRGMDRGLALLGLGLLVVVALVLPDAVFGLPAVVAAGLAFLGVVEIARRDRARRALDAEPHGRQRALAIVAASITGVAFLSLVHGNPERLAPVLAGVAVTALLALRLRTPRTSWPPRRPTRTARVDERAIERTIERTIERAATT